MKDTNGVDGSMKLAPKTGATDHFFRLVIYESYSIHDTVHLMKQHR